MILAYAVRELRADTDLKGASASEWWKPSAHRIRPATTAVALGGALIALLGGIALTAARLQNRP